MLLQVLNIAMGLLALLPELRDKKVVTEHVLVTAEPWKAGVGVAGLAFGFLGLLMRMGILYLPTLWLGESYPQVIPAILLGLLLATRHIEKQPWLRNASLRLQPYRVWLGALGIAVGLGSLLFGCISPVFCGAGLPL